MMVSASKSAMAIVMRATVIIAIGEPMAFCSLLERMMVSHGMHHACHHPGCPPAAAVDCAQESHRRGGSGNIQHGEERIRCHYDGLHDSNPAAFGHPDGDQVRPNSPL
jgi:hypothetical protein